MVQGPNLEDLAYAIWEISLLLSWVDPYLFNYSHYGVLGAVML